MQHLTRLLCALLLLCGSTRAFGETEAFTLQAPAVFAGAEITRDGGTLGTFSCVRDPGDWSGSYAALTNVAFDSEDSGPWTFSANGWTATLDADSIAAARSNGNVLGLTFTPPQIANPVQDFLIAAQAATNTLILVQPANGAYVATPLSVGAASELTPGFFFCRASAPFDPSLPLWVVDVARQKSAPSGATFIADGWANDATAYPFGSVTYYLNASEDGGNFTLHSQLPGQAEVLSSLSAAPGPQDARILSDGVYENEAGSVCVTGLVSAGAKYWLTRDADGLVSEVRAGASGALQWSLRSAGALQIPWQTATFHVAVTNSGALSVQQPDGYRTLTPSDTGVLTLEDWDIWGNPHPFYYQDWTAQIDPHASFWLMSGSTEVSQGETWFCDGWIPQHGVPQDRQLRAFGIALGFGGESFGASAFVTDTSGQSPLALASGVLRLDDYLEDGTPHHFSYELWNANVDVSRPFFLTANGQTLPAGELWFTNGWQPQGGLPADWQSLTFIVPLGSGQLSLAQGNASRPRTYSLSGYFEDYSADGEGTPNFFLYDAYTATVDMNRPFYFSVEGNTLGDHETAWYGGWQAQNGSKVNRFTLSLTLHASLFTHDFTISEPDGTT